MKNDLPDEKLDQVMRQLLNDAALDESQVNDIADSPTMWWAVQRRINEQKTARSPWPPIRPWKRWLMIGLPTAAVAVLAIAFLISRAPVTNKDVAGDLTVQPSTPIAAVREDKSTPPVDDAKELTVTTSDRQPKAMNHVARVAKTSQPRARIEVTASNKPEIKTEFIALTYARDPDSGQIIRVKVPSSMMVTLGVVATVKKPTDMVDAEVLVGDDGLTRAIRFIH